MSNLSQKTFRKSFEISKELLKWYPGHMDKSFKVMQRKMAKLDCIVEVHDARIALSGRNPNFISKLIGDKPHILVLNKVDLIEKKDVALIRKKLDMSGVQNLLFTNCLKGEQCKGLKEIIPTAIELIKNSDRYNRAERSSLYMMIIGIPNVGKSSIINALRNINLNRSKATRVGAEAGVTKSVLSKIKVNGTPEMFLYDTPGVLPPQIKDNETGLKIALCACMNDTVVTEIVIADFLLFWLNKTDNFSYVDKIGLSEPVDEILPLLTLLAVRENKFNYVLDVQTNKRKKIPNFNYAAQKFIRFFRKAEFGLINLDKQILEC